MVENLVGIELAYINTKHPDFHEAGLIHKALTGGDYTSSTPKHDNRVSLIEYSLKKVYICFFRLRIMMNQY